MPYVVLYNSGHTMITDDEPINRFGNIRSAVVCDNIGHALAVQGMVINAYGIAKENDAANALTHECDALHSTIDTQAQIIRDNSIHVENLENEIASERTKTRDREIILHNVMGALALDMALERTHRQRNAALRHIVRLIKRILDNVGLPDDDIPF